MKTAVPIVVALVALLAVAPIVRAQSIRLEPVVSGLSSPVAVTHAGDARLFIVERPGRILIWDGGELLAEPFLDISERVRSGGEQGLLSVAFHPGFASNGRFFVNYTELDGDTIVSRFRVLESDPDRGDPASEVVLLEIEQPFANHNGGQLQFGPDGMLWIGMGDGGSADDPRCNAQRGDTLLGKLLRIDVDAGDDAAPFYSVPVDNPFVGSAEQLDEVWALGLRNPWRFSFDRETGDLWIGDVGQSAREEIDFVAAGSSGGENFGWKRLEGSLCRDQTGGCPGPIPPCGSPAYTLPVLEYGHDQGCSVTGGYVYRGTAIPALVGRYLYGDFCSGTIQAASRQSGGGWSAEALGVQVPELSSFGEDVTGELHLTSLAGTLYRIEAAGGTGPGVVEATTDEVTVAEGAGAFFFSVQRSGGSDGDVSVRVRTVADGAARADVDFVSRDTVVRWADGESGPREVPISIIGDDTPEAPESFSITLGDVVGGAELGRRSTTVVIEDDDVAVEPCVESETVLCLADGRFRVEIEWRDFEDRRGSGRAQRLTPETGWFWFFRPDNVEVVVKVLDGCLLFDRYWVFAAGLTNVETRMTVVDSANGTLRVYDNELGDVFEPVQDTGAFDTCP